MIAGPWYISAAAVRDYLRITGKRGDQTDGPEFEAAERALLELARGIVAAGKSGTELDTGAYQFRGPRPLRLRLIVSYEKREEGDLPQLVAVKPDHEGRSGAYSRSAPARKRGHDR